MGHSESFEPAVKAQNQLAESTAFNQQWQEMNMPHRGIASARASGRMPAPAPESHGVEVGEAKPAPASKDALVLKNEAGVIFLKPYPGQLPLRDYPGGRGTEQDVNDTREALGTVPGPAGVASRQAFELFDKNYNSRANENTTPTMLALTDVPKSVSDKVTNWQLHYDVDLYQREAHGPLGVRDLRPRTDVAPGGGKLPKDFFAVGFDAEGKPVDVLKYDDPGTGSRYLGQYQISYETLADGTGRRVTIKNWVDADMNREKLSGPQQVIGNRLNTLAGVTQYYYDNDGKIVDARYYQGSTMLLDRSQWKPADDMRYSDGLAAGTMEERTRASRMDFFNLFGPRLPDVRNGQ